MTLSIDAYCSWERIDHSYTAGDSKNERSNEYLRAGSTPGAVAAGSAAGSTTGIPLFAVKIFLQVS
jgi:uncharacterized protein (DUF2062 family)